MKNKLLKLLVFLIAASMLLPAMPVMAAAPDLIISDITISNPYYKIGDVVSFSVTTKNVGNADANSGWIGMGLNVNGVGLGYKGGEVTIAPNGIYTQTFTDYTVTSEQLKLVGSTDTSMVITESNENNNSTTIDLVPLKEGVDLIISSLELVNDSFKSGDVVQFRLGVENVGALDMDYQSVNFEMKINKTTVSFSEIMAIPSKSYYTLITDGIAVNDDSIEVSVKVNAEGKIDEAIFNNNEITNTFTHVERTEYNWDTVRLGGGGFVTGAAIHPTQQDVFYVRTDVGGAYKWNGKTNEWKPITDWISRADNNLYGIQGIAIDEKNSDNIYLCAGVYSNKKLAGWSRNAEPNDVLRSMDGGETWTRLNLNLDFEGNGENRSAGEPIAVDPNNSDILYVGTVYDGLYKTTNATAKSVKWEKVELPTFAPSQDYNKPEGIRNIVFDKTSAKGGKTQTIYVGALSHGIYKTTNGGKSWELMPGSPTNPGRITIAENGVIYCSAYNGVYKYESGVWSDISPEKSQKYLGITVQPGNPNVIVCARNASSFRNSIYVSENAGNSWRLINDDAKAKSDVTWWGSEKFAACIAWVLFDPTRPSRVWFGDWYGIWVCEDILAEETEWTTYETGHEEMVAFDMATPTVGAPLFTVMADNDGVRHEDITEFPSTQFKNPSMSDGNGIEFCEEDPNIVVRVGGYHWGESGDGGYTLDGGDTWIPFPTYPTNEDGVKLPNGRVVVSAKKNANGFPTIIVTPINSKPYRSTDMGQTWQEISSLTDKGVSTYWSTNIPTEADRVNGNVFYYYDKSSGEFYTSNDNGVSFTKVATLPANSQEFVRSAPGIEGEVWVSLDKNGLYRSSNQGRSFVKLENVQESFLMGWGKGVEDSNIPVAYVMGKIYNKEGIFRSLDLGQTWELISDNEHMMGCSPKCIKGDRQTFGVVYIGTGGRGFYYGAPAGLDMKAPKVVVKKASEMITRNAKYTVQGAVSESAQIDVSVNGNVYTVKSDENNEFSQSISLVLGENKIRVVAKDNAGNISEVEEFIVVHDPSYIEVILDPRSSVTKDTMYTVSGVVNVRNNASTISINDNTYSVNEDGTFAAQIKLAEGNNTVKITASDAENHTRTTEINVFKDSIPPEIILYSQDNEVDDDMFILEGEVSEACKISVGSKAMTVDETTNLSFKFPLSLNYGKNIVNVLATDTAGNTVVANVVLKYSDFVLGPDDTMPGHNVLIEKASTVNLDGVFDEPEWKINKRISKTASGETDNVAKFGLMGDDKYMYVGIRVFDGTITKHNSTTVYQNDSIEFYIDASNGKEGSYSVNDNQIFIDLDGVITAANGTIEDYACIVKENDYGYDIEAKISWADLKVVGVSSNVFGFDIALNDNDNADERGGVLVWAGNGDNWKSKAAFGNAYIFTIN